MPPHLQRGLSERLRLCGLTVGLALALLAGCGGTVGGTDATTRAALVASVQKSATGSPAYLALGPDDRAWVVDGTVRALDRGQVEAAGLALFTHQLSEVRRFEVEQREEETVPAERSLAP